MTSDLFKETPLGKLAYSVAGAVLVLDQASKAFILHGIDLPIRQQMLVLPPFFNLTMVWNRGVSFGLLKAGADLGRFALIAFAAFVVAILGIWARRVDRPLIAWAVGLIMGGAIGNNLIDRPIYGAVVDFLDFSGLMFPWVFNVADSAITIGVVLLLIDSLRPPKPDASKKA